MYFIPYSFKSYLSPLLLTPLHVLFPLFFLTSPFHFHFFPPRSPSFSLLFPTIYCHYLPTTSCSLEVVRFFRGLFFNNAVTSLCQQFVHSHKACSQIHCDNTVLAVEDVFCCVSGCYAKRAFPLPLPPSPFHPYIPIPLSFAILHVYFLPWPFTLHSHSPCISPVFFLSIHLPFPFL